MIPGEFLTHQMQQTFFTLKWEFNQRGKKSHVSCLNFHKRATCSGCYFVNKASFDCRTNRRQKCPRMANSPATTGRWFTTSTKTLSFLLETKSGEGMWRTYEWRGQTTDINFNFLWLCICWKCQRNYECFFEFAQEQIKNGTFLTSRFSLLPVPSRDLPQSLTFIAIFSSPGRSFPSRSSGVSGTWLRCSGCAATWAGSAAQSQRSRRSKYCQVQCPGK